MKLHATSFVPAALLGVALTGVPAARAQVQAVLLSSGESEGGIEMDGNPQLANGGKVAFRGSRRVGFEHIDGVYAGFAGGVNEIAEQSSAVPGFEEIGEVGISSNGTVGFWALARTPREDDPERTNANGRIFTTDNPYENIWNTNQNEGLVAINDQKELAWGTPFAGLYFTGRPLSDESPNSSAIFASGYFGRPQDGQYIPRAVINNEGQVAFVYRPPGETLLEVRRGQAALPETIVTTLASGFESIYSLGLDDSGRAVFVGRLPGGNIGIYAASGGSASALAVSVDDGPGFSNFGTVAVSSGGQIAFTASYTAPDGRSRSGIFKGFNGLSDKVVADGDPVTVNGVAGTISVGNFWPRCVDDSGQVLFGGSVNPPDHDEGEGGGAGPASVRPSSHAPSVTGLFLTMGTPDPPDDEPPGDDEDDDPENTHTWINDAGGAFATASNWEPAQVPVRNSERADSARFNLGAAYTVATPEAATERLIVRGGDVTLNVGLYAVGGSDPNAPSVSVTRSGILRVTGGTLQSVNTAIGNGALSSGQIAEAHVFNTGTTWTNPGQMTIGRFSQGRLFVANGPTLTTGEARIGMDARGEAIVGGVGSFWDAGSLAVGFSHEGTLAIESGGRLTAEYLHIGRAGGDGIVVVDGIADNAPSRLIVSDSFGNFRIGEAGGVGELRILAGGLAEATLGGFLAVGLRDGDSVGTGRVLVRGSDAGSGTRSTLRLDPLEPDLLGTLFVGWGGDGELRIEQGGLVQTDSGVVANQDGTVGVAVIDGHGGGHDSHWEIEGELLVGLRGSGRLEISGGGLVSTNRLFSGGTSGSLGRVLVSGVATGGTSSRLFVNDSLARFVIGRDAGEGELTVADGGWVEARETGGFLAIGGTGGKGRVFVRGVDAATGVRSRITIVPLEPELLGLLHVGWGGDGALRIEDGGLVQCESAVIANDTAALGLVEVVGSRGATPSLLENGSSLDVGLRGSGQLVVEAGGQVTSRRVVVGSLPGGNGMVMVRGAAADGTPSTLQFGGTAAFVLGLDGGSGELVVQSGARVTTSEGTGVVLRRGEIRIQGTDPISGSRSALFLDHAEAGRGALDVYEGSSVTITEGGTVRCRTARIGGLGSEGGAALVDITGTGASGPSCWHASVSLTVGAGLAPGSTGVLSVVDGGAVTIGDAEPQAHLVRIGAGGTLNGNGTIVAPGGVGVAGGVDNFAGTVSPGNSPGTLTIEGNYTQGAAGVLEIEIGGLERGYDYDVLAVSGAITFEPGAKIRVTFIDPNPDDAVAETFVPRTGDVFSFLVADTLGLPASTTLGDVIEFTNLPVGVVLDFATAVIAGTTVVTATTTAAPPAASWRITAHPRSVLATAGTATTFGVTLEGATGATYQWRRNGADIPGATEATFTLASPQLFHTGDAFSVAVTASGTSAASRVATLAVTAAAPSTSRLLNLSTRAQTLIGDNVLIPGFVVAGTGTKRLLLRAVGPTLSHPPYNVGGTLDNPQMALKRLDFSVSPPAYVDIAANDNWGENANATDITRAIGDLFAFPFEDDREAALLLDLAPGQYTVFADGVNAATGIAIVELYDADDSSPTTTLVNISNRGFVGTGDAVMIPGFVVSSEGPKTLLIRVVGPTLAAPPYNVPGTMADPRLQVFRKESDGRDTLLLAQDNWNDNTGAAHTRQIAADLSAFPLVEGSADAAFVVTLPPGTYTVVGSSADGTSTGIVLVEVYVVP